MTTGQSNEAVFFLDDSYIGSDVAAPTDFECKVKRNWQTAGSTYDLKVGQTVQYYAGYKIFSEWNKTTTVANGLSANIMSYNVTEGAASLLAASAAMVAALMF